MATLLDYIKTNGNRDYHSLALNELDVAVINEIGYLAFDELVADDNHLEATIKLSQLPLLQTREIKGIPMIFKHQRTVGSLSNDVSVKAVFRTDLIALYQ